MARQLAGCRFESWYWQNNSNEISLRVNVQSWFFGINSFNTCKMCNGLIISSVHVRQMYPDFSQKLFKEKTISIIKLEQS